MRRWPAIGLLFGCGVTAVALVAVGDDASPPVRGVECETRRAPDCLVSATGTSESGTPDVGERIATGPRAEARAPAAAPPAAAPSLVGRVVARTGEAIGGGTVALVRDGKRRAVVSIGRDGAFRFRGDVSGAVALVARPDTHAPARVALDPSACRDDVRIVVERGETLAIDVVDAVRERALPGVVVSVVDPATGVVRRGPSGRDGRLRVTALPHADASRLRVTVDDPAWFALRDADGAAVGRAGDVAVVRVVRAVCVEGVVSARGRPLGGARVHVRIAARCERVVGPGTDAVVEGEAVVAAWCGETDPAGRYRLDGVPPFEALTLVVRADGHHGVARALRARPGVTRVVDVALASDRAIAGRVVAADGSASAATVWVADATRVVRRIDVDAAGRFAVESLPRGRFRLRAVAADGRGSTVVRARGGDRVVLRLSQPAGPIRGRVVDAFGRPCVGARVELVPSAMPGLFDGEPFALPTAVCDTAGRFVVGRLRARWRYRVRATTVDGASVESTPCAPGAPPVRLVATRAGRLVARLVEPSDGAAVVRLGGRIVGRGGFGGGAVATIDGVPAGRVRVDAVDREGVVFATRTAVDVAPGGTVEVALDPDATRDLVGVAVDPSGRPIAGLPVATLLAEDAPRRTTTGPDGRFALRALPPGRRDVALGDAATGFTIARGLHPGPAVRVVHAPAGRIEVRVHADRDGRPIGHAVVGFVTAGRAAGCVTCDPNGVAAWATSSGRYAIVAEADGYRPAAARAVVPARGGVVHVALRLAAAR